MPKFTVTHRYFCLAYTALYYVLYNVLNITPTARWFVVKDGTDVAALAAFYLIGYLLFVFIFMLLAQRFVTKLLACVLVLAGAAGSYFINKYQVNIDSSMLLNVVYTDRTEVRALLSWQMLPYVLIGIVLPLLLINRITITYPRRYFLGSLAIMVPALLGSVLVAYWQFQGISRAANLSKKQIVHTLLPINVVQSLGSIAQHAIEDYQARTHESVAITGRQTQQRNLVVVLAIGETARQANFSLYGYQRKNTNPKLQAISGLHLLNGHARKGSTLYALPEILRKDAVTLPEVTSVLGVDTACYVNFTLYDNCTVPGEVAVSNCAHGDRCYDEDVLPLLKQKLATRSMGSSLVVLHLGGGSHGPNYQERYPPEHQQFKPLCTDADVINQCTREQLFNSFDNTILYTDHVLAEIITTLEQSAQPYVFIYLSDHGESLLEGGRIFHGMPPGIPLPEEQARIPLIVKSSLPISISERAQYEQRDIFDTVLALLSIDSPIHEPARSFITIK